MKYVHLGFTITTLKIWDLLHVNPRAKKNQQIVMGKTRGEEFKIFQHSIHNKK